MFEVARDLGRLSRQLPQFFFGSQNHQIAVFWEVITGTTLNRFLYDFVPNSAVIKIFFFYFVLLASTFTSAVGLSSSSNACMGAFLSGKLVLLAALISPCCLLRSTFWMLGCLLVN